MATTNVRVSIASSFPPLFATNSVLPQMPLRTRPVQRSKADENATSRHARQPSGIVPPGASRFTAKELVGAKSNQSRTVLSEVTLAAVNRKVCTSHPF
jgi:hypothetical protein